MPETTQPGRSGPKGPRLDHNKETPAYRIIYGHFGSLSAFCKTTGVPPGTAHLWLNTGLIPSRRQEDVMTKASAAGMPIPAELFVPIPKAA